MLLHLFPNIVPADALLEVYGLLELANLMLLSQKVASREPFGAVGLPIEAVMDESTQQHLVLVKPLGPRLGLNGIRVKLF